ncbi:RHS repeat-associated core domain-containing protein [Aquimarina sp. U1-2]|uniref:DUF6443 domain-containing protein n=1 Tax=Aquimarina sp. U1-2 TaxID=2823141 RepID=UPI001AECA94B|nr:DUF6443 domain-containing protein [Aquimarina sp. U1-2]MBP2832610.1 RHS repeat-associated core domain-containing protein [Aquimarina sp. U1-2]
MKTNMHLRPKTYSFTAMVLMLFFALCSSNVVSQSSVIGGDTSVLQGEIRTYNLKRSPKPPFFTQWDADGKIISSDNYRVRVQWTRPGRKLVSVAAENEESGNDVVFGDLEVMVTAVSPDPPENPTIISNGCGRATLKRNDRLPDNVEWYWQGKSPNGTSTDLGRGTTFVANQGSGRYYLRAKFDVTNQWSESSASVYVNMVNLSPGSITGDQTVCFFRSPGVLSNVSLAGGVSGSVSYQWQYSSNGSSGWTNIEGATATSYDPPRLTASRWYRRRASCASQTRYTSPVKVTVNPPLVPGSILGAQTICFNGDPGNLSSTSSASGGNGSYSYQWQYSDNGSTGWTNISGATSNTYNPPSGLTSSRWYKRRVYSCSQTKYTDAVKVTVNPPLTAGAISGTQSICYGGDPSTINNSTSPANGLGGYAYQWQYSNNGSSGWTNISGATSNQYDPPGGLTATRWYRRRVVSCGQTSYTSAAKVTVNFTTWYADTDDDGLGDPNTTQRACSQPEGYVANADDRCPAEYGEYQGCLFPVHDLNLSNENYVFTRLYQEPMNSPSEIRYNKDVIESVTYFDGLGRAKQQRAIHASPDQKDIVTHITYDDYGRQDKQYLPFVSGDNGTFKTVNVLDDINSYYLNKHSEDFPGITNPLEVNAYSESVFEQSPLNRVLEQGAPGTAWKADPGSDHDHTIKFDWATNTTGEVIRFDVNFPNPNNTEAPALQQNGHYLANELYVTITKDENWKPGDEDLRTTRAYKDKLGNVILKRTFNSSSPSTGGGGEAGGGAHDTYYVYDDFGNLTYVIPPKVNTSDGVTQSELNELCYQYRYDYRNRLIEKKIPGKGDQNNWESIVYNKLDQPVLTQDPNQKAKNEWLFTKYDAFGRVAYTGKITIPNKTRKQLQTEATAYNNKLWVQRGSAVMIGGTTMHYNNGGYPNVQNAEVLTINYYDDYDFDRAGINDPGTVYGVGTSDRTKSLSTGSKVKVLGTSFWITTVTYYDNKGRVIYTESKNEYLDTHDSVKSKLDFTGKVEKTHTYHKKGSHEAIVTEDTFTYDHVGRLTSQNQKINNQDAEQIVANSYDELGQLVQKNVGGTVTASGSAAVSPLQTVNYHYNIRGWLKGINDVNNLGDDVFAFGIGYTDQLGVAAPLFNGNINKTEWHSATQDAKQGYFYSYDALNRLTDAFTGDARHDVSNISYDKGGNLLSLQRNGKKANGDLGGGAILAETAFLGLDVFLGGGFESDSELIDDLVYIYESGNRLSGVVDLTFDPAGQIPYSGIGGQYNYDLNGNMISDEGKGISSITYNHLNLPETITITNPGGGSNPDVFPVEGEGTPQSGTILYIYDALGTKLKKQVITQSTIDETLYAGNFVYKNRNLDFFNQPEGYVEKEDDGYKYIYQFKDHLGNIRLSYSDADSDGKVDVLKNNTDIDGDGDYQNEIREEKAYYPFGMTFQEEELSLISGNVHPYGFNGKEEQNELGLDWLDFGARNYDAALGRWMNIDNHADTYYNWSPYTYAINDPVNVIDPDGNDIYILTWFSTDKNGGETGHAGIAIDNYKTVNKKDANGNDILDANGNPVTEQVADGTFTYYDLWPKDPVGNLDMQDDVDSGYSEGIQINSISDLKNTDVTTQVNGNVHTEGRSADGIVQISTSFQQDEAAKNVAETEIQNRNQYNACKNNCSTFTQRVANTALGSGNQINAKQRISPGWTLRALGYKATDVIAPNNLYNAALKAKGAKKVKGPVSVQAKPYLEYFGKN